MSRNVDFASRLTGTFSTHRSLPLKTGLTSEQDGTPLNQYVGSNSFLQSKILTKFFQQRAEQLDLKMTDAQYKEVRPHRTLPFKTSTGSEI